jgi:6-phosphogluconate dehydrogenase
MRYRSQEQDTFSGKVVAALRNEFGGHAVEKK